MGNNKIIGAKIKSIRESNNFPPGSIPKRSRSEYRTNRTYRGQYRLSVSRPANQDSPRIRRTLGTFLDDQAELAPSFAARKIATTRTASVLATTTARHANTWNTIRCHKTSRAAIWNRS